MSWPDDLKWVGCTGFPRAILPALQKAVSTNQIKWTHNATVGHAFFEWMNCTWRIDDLYEMVTHIALIDGDINNQDLTAIVLIG